MARPRVLSTKVTEEEHQAVVEEANALGMTVAGFLRYSLGMDGESGVKNWCYPELVGKRAA